jgi:hypothetical protein
VFLLVLLLAVIFGGAVAFRAYIRATGTPDEVQRLEHGGALTGNK